MHLAMNNGKIVVASNLKFVNGNLFEKDGYAKFGQLLHGSDRWFTAFFNH